MDHLEVQLLGPLAAFRGGARLDLGPRRQRAVLAVLALSGAVVPVDRLIDQVWAQNPPGSALGTVHAYLSNLRRVLEPDRRPGSPASVLVTEPPGYVLRLRPDAVDADRFERDLASARVRRTDPARALDLVERALGQWSGPPLADFADEPFAQPWRARIEELRATAHEVRFDALLALGAAAQVAADVGPVIDAWPLREVFRAQLVLALARDGRTAEALRAYEASRRFLAEELGLPPGAQLAEAHRRVLAGDLAPAGGGAVPPAGGGAVAPAGRGAAAPAGRGADAPRPAPSPHPRRRPTLAGGSGSRRCHLRRRPPPPASGSCLSRDR